MKKTTFPLLALLLIAVTAFKPAINSELAIGAPLPKADVKISV